MSILNSGILSGIKDNTSGIKDNTRHFIYKMEDRQMMTANGGIWESEMITAGSESIAIDVQHDDAISKIELVFYDLIYGIQSTVVLKEGGPGVIRRVTVTQYNIPTQRFKVRITNNSDIDRRVNGVLVWRKDVDFNWMNDVYFKDSLNEIKRPKHTVLVHNKLTLAAGQTINNIDIFGETNPYLKHSYLNVSDFSFIYFSIHSPAVPGAGIKYYLQNWFFTSANDPENDFNGFSNAWEYTVASEPWLKVIDSTERYSNSGWIEVQGTHIWTYFKNEGPEEREFIISITGIR